LQGLEQTVELHVGLFLPVELQQAFDQLRLLLFKQKAVGQIQIDRITPVHVRTGQTEEQAELARQPGEKPTGPDVRIQSDGDLRHRQATARRDDPRAGTLQQAHAAAEHVTVAPADQRFGVGMQAVVQAIFGGEKLRGQWRDFAGMGAAGFHQAAHFAAGAECLGAVTAQQHADDLWILGPGVQLVAQGVDHRQGQRVERLFSIQAGDCEAGAVGAGEFFEVQIHRDLDREFERSV